MGLIRELSRHPARNSPLNSLLKRVTPQWIVYFLIGHFFLAHLTSHCAHVPRTQQLRNTDLLYCIQLTLSKYPDSCLMIQTFKY